MFARVELGPIVLARRIVLIQLAFIFFLLSHLLLFLLLVVILVEPRPLH